MQRLDSRPVAPAALLALLALLSPPQARPAGADARLELKKGDRVVLIGNTLVERMGTFGHFDALLHARFPALDLVVRNLGWSADELALRPRSAGFADHGHALADHKPDVLVAGFGFNEAFAGKAGLPHFEKALADFLRASTTTKYNGTAPPKLVVLSPIPHEDLGNPDLPDGKADNANLKLYTDAMARVCATHNDVIFINLFTPTLAAMRGAKTKLTFNGVHLTESGDKRVAEILDGLLFGPRPAGSDKVDADQLLAEVRERNLQFWYDYRAVNGAYIYGGRKTPFGVVNFPQEFAKLRKMIDKRDARVWAVSRGEAVPSTIDDSDSGTLAPVVSNVKEPVKILDPQEERKTFTLAPGFEVNLYASEVEFPDLEKPCQFAFDARGRLWVATMGSYPMYLPGRPVNDKVLILEDTKGAGKADKCGVFADGLYLPTGIALGDGGAYVAQQPNLIFLKDTKGTGKADYRERVLHGFDTADSHHAINAFRWGPGGDLFFMEGTFHHSQVETPYGPRRLVNSGVYRYEPRTAKLDVWCSYNFANPWGIVFDAWGQPFVADASGGANYYGTAFSGDVDYPRKHAHLNEFLKKQWRPTCGCAFVSSRHFPDSWQGDYLLNNTIGFQGILRYKMKEDGSGFSASPAEPLLKSTDRGFRPVDTLFGPDGALYVCDWYNPLVGHMQHSVRDPKRDHTHGRIWRVTAKGRPPLKAPKVAGATVPELLELLRAYEYPTRDQARMELRLHDTKAVTAAVERWTAGLDPKDKAREHLLLEALWVCQHHNAVNEPLLKKVLGSPDTHARAAAVKVLCCWRDRVADPLETLRGLVNDAHPRVRLEAVRALSFFHEEKAREIALESVAQPQDYYLEYTLKETLATLDARLKAK